MSPLFLYIVDLNFESLALAFLYKGHHIVSVSSTICIVRIWTPWVYLIFMVKCLILFRVLLFLKILKVQKFNSEWMGCIRLLCSRNLFTLLCCSIRFTAWVYNPSFGQPFPLLYHTFQSLVFKMQGWLAHSLLNNTGVRQDCQSEDPRLSS